MQIRKLEEDLNSEIILRQLNQLKSNLRGENGISKSSKKILKNIGLKVSMSKSGHYMITDGQTQYYCSKTPSDQRNGLNVYSGIRKNFFPQSYHSN